jgi:hypothetical protein
MIWFACTQCGKRHGRPEAAIGSVIFCDCGHGNRVPWESTVAAPPPEEEPETARPAGPPRLEPVPVGEERRPPPLPDRPARRLRSRGRDPAWCFNHSDLPSEITCGACEEHFCRQCVVTLQGKTLCGPCKNHQLRTLARPPRISGLALAAVIIAWVAGPFIMMIVVVTAATGGTSAPLLLIGFGALPEMVAFVLGALALYRTETDPKIGGQAVAVTAMVTAVVATLVLGALVMRSAMALV